MYVNLSCNAHFYYKLTNRKVNISYENISEEMWLYVTLCRYCLLVLHGCNRPI